MFERLIRIHPRHSRLLLLALMLVAPLVVGCSTVPYTGRSQLNFLSEEDELALGAEAYQTILAEETLSQDGYWTETLDRVGFRIAAVAEAPNFGWEFKLIDSATVNAFCLPGGKVAFYTGIIPLCQDETGIAVVMGHEVAHAIARHGAERVSQGLLLEVGLASIYAALALGSDEDTAGLVVAALGAGATLGVVLPFSRDHESEADYIGLMLMAKAGYDPREAPRFWERMAAASSGEQPPEFLSTHPSHETRVDNLNEWMPEALQYYRAP